MFNKKKPEAKKPAAKKAGQSKQGEAATAAKQKADYQNHPKFDKFKRGN